MAQSFVRAPVRWTHDAPLRQVAGLLDIAVVHAYGLVTALTGYLMDEKRSGMLHELPDTEIAGAAGWEGDAGHFVHVLLNNYTDGSGVLLGWSQTAEPILAEREANRRRVEEFRKRSRARADREADEYLASQHGATGAQNGAGANGAASLPSASRAAPQRAAQQPAADRVATPKTAATTVGPVGPPNRRTAEPPETPDPTTANTPQASAPGLPVTGDAIFGRPVMGDTSDTVRVSLLSGQTFDARVEGTHDPNTFVMRDIVMGDVMGDSFPQSPDVTRYASRAVVQDLEQQTSSQVEQRSQTTEKNQSSSSEVRDLSTGTSHSVGRPRVFAKMTALSASFLGVPSEGVAGRDDLVAMYGRHAEQAWGEVRSFVTKFYREASEERQVEVLNTLILLQSPAGVASGQGPRLANVSARAVREAVIETTQRPPKSADAAIVFVLRKLTSGKANLELDQRGLTTTEAASERHRAQDRVIAPAVKRAIDAAGGRIGRTPATTTADEQKTAVRWMLGSPGVKAEIAEDCERTFASWQQDLPGLGDLKSNWVRTEALKRWRALGRPLPPPPK